MLKETSLFLKISLLPATMLMVGLTAGQQRKAATFDVNEVTLRFTNHGTFSELLWPKSDGLEYLFEGGFLIGAEVVDKHGETRQIFSDGLSPASGGEFEPGTASAWGWQPLPGYDNPDYNSVAMSNNPNSWPSGWFGWPGRFGSGVLNADRETFWVMDDRENAEFPYFPLPEDTLIRGLGIEITGRGYQWKYEPYQDFVIFSYDIRNVSDRPLDKLVLGLFTDPTIGGPNDFGDDIVGINFDWDYVYAADADGVGDGGRRPGVIGFAILETPDGIGMSSVAAPLFGSNNLPANDERMWELMTPGNFQPLEQEADQVIVIGSGYFSLAPGETTRYSFAVVLGSGPNDLQRNVIRSYGAVSLTGMPETDTSTRPTGIVLNQNYPNPFNPQTTISYSLAKPARVTLKIYSALGREIRTLVNARQAAGEQRVLWDGRDDRGRRVSSGIYVYCLQVGSQVNNRKMVLLR